MNSCAAWLAKKAMREKRNRTTEPEAEGPGAVEKNQQREQETPETAETRTKATTTQSPTHAQS